MGIDNYASETMYGFISFNLSSVSSGCLSAATLTLQRGNYVYSGTTYQGTYPDQSPVATMTLQNIPSFSNGMTWNTYGSASWTVQSTIAESFTKVATDVYSLSLTSAFISYTTNNILSMRITTNTGSFASGQVWWTSDNTNSSLWPTLAVTYSICDPHATCSSGACSCNSTYTGNGLVCYREQLIYYFSFHLS